MAHDACRSDAALAACYRRALSLGMTLEQIAAADQTTVADVATRAARDVAPGDCWAFRDHRTLAQVSP